MPSIFTSAVMLVTLVILLNAAMFVATAFDGYWIYIFAFSFVYFFGWWLLRKWYLNPERPFVRWITRLADTLDCTRAFRRFAIMKFATLLSRYLAVQGVIFGFAAIGLGHSFAGFFFVAVGTSAVIAVESMKRK